MDAVEFLKEKERMCEIISCTQCKLSTFFNEENMRCGDYRREYPEKYVDYIEKWSKKNSRKTMLSDRKEFK